MERSPRLGRVRTTWALGALIALPVAAHLPELVGWISGNPAYLLSGLGLQLRQSFQGFPGWIDPNAGYYTQAVGALAARDWLAGRVPWWNPFTGVGMPLAAQAASSALFLPFVLLLRFFDGVLYLKIALQMVAGLATWGLLRELGRSRLTAWMGAALFMLNGTFAWYAHAPIMPIAFLPMLLLGIERAARFSRAGTAGGWGWIATATGWSLLAGFPEIAYLDGLLALAWALLRLRQASGSRGRLAAKLLLGGGVGLLLAAPQLVPFAELYAVAGHGIHGPALAHASIRPWVYATYLTPYLYGPLWAWGHGDWGLPGGYVGLPPVLLALVAVLGARRGPECGLRLLLAAWILITLLKASDAPGITRAVNLVPLVAISAAWRLVQPSWQLGCAVLTAFAIDDWRGGALNGWRRPATALVIATLLLGGAVWAGQPLAREVLKAAPREPLFETASVVWAAAIAAGLATLCAMRPRPALAACLVGLLTVDALAMTAIPPLASGVRKASLDGAVIGFLGAHLGLQRFGTLGPFAPNYGAMFRLASVNYNVILDPLVWSDFVRRSLDPSADDVLFVGWYPPGPVHVQALRRSLPAYAAVGVQYLLAVPGTHALPTPPVLTTPTTEIYRLSDPAPYWQADGCTLTGSDRLAVQATCSAATRLIRRELFFPGWSATVGGRAASITEVPPLFQSVLLPAGSSTVRFAYAPPHSGAAWTACAAGAAILLAGLALSSGRSFPGSARRADRAPS